ncbi:AMP-binding protein [Desulfobulbus sp.]|uniref:(2,3-dihydroxybenzoyl)adenylate synthase n=1 Tax=Desulfobulbus sp. TaxID=895 RepID=UPI00286F534F|nr:AMP-binding protein [Desulfobulbus sp.]
MLIRTNEWYQQAARSYQEKGYWQPWPLGQQLRRWAQAHGERIALVDGEDRLSYLDLDRRVDAMAVGLHRLGLRCGDRVLLQLPNSTAFVVTAFALFRLGVVPVMMMMANRERDIDAFCDLARPTAYITTAAFLGHDHRVLAEKAQERHNCLRYVLIDGAWTDDHGVTCHIEIPNETYADDGQPNATATAVLLLSGGTTGTSKLIPRTHADYAYNARESAKLCGFTADTVYLAALPVAHNFPLACPGIIGTFSVGGKVVLTRSPAFEEAFPLIERERVTHTALVPPLVNLWLNACEWERSDLSSLVLLQVGGAALDPQLAARVGPTLGCRLQQVFGMAEGLLCYTRLDDPESIVLHTQGRPLSPDDEIRIVDADGKEVAYGEAGELQVRGPYTIRGYYCAEAQNKSSFTEDGFYRSGDWVRITAEGNFIVEGRIKDIVNRAGEKIAAPEIEAMLKAHPDIQDAALVPLPDEHLGERSCAFVMAKGATLDLPAIRTFMLAKGAARHKIPDQLELIDFWPLTGAGKIDKRKLVAMAAG